MHYLSKEVNHIGEGAREHLNEYYMQRCVKRGAALTFTNQESIKTNEWDTSSAIRLDFWYVLHPYHTHTPCNKRLTGKS